jgi:uncharacterized protein YndB with AHSA1/START domain
MMMKMEKAQVSLPSEREVMVMRSFKAPKALVYRAFTEPTLLRRWMLGPPGWSMTVCEMATRVGDAYRWRWRNEQDGTEFGFSGVFRELEPGARIAHTQRYDAGTTGVGESGGECLVTLTFEEKAGLTLVTTSLKFDTKAERDAAVASGMTDGMEMSYQGLDAILAESQ